MPSECSMSLAAWGCGFGKLSGEGWGMGLCPALTCPLLGLMWCGGWGSLQDSWVGSLMWVSGGGKPSKFKMRKYP